MDIDIGYWLLEYELDQMSRYLELVQVALQNYGEGIEDSYARVMKQEMTEDEIAFLEADYGDLFVEAGHNLPQLLLSSFIISWYSLVEQKLLDLCEQLNLKTSIGPKENEYFRKGIRGARKFLYRTKGYEIDLHQWEELINISKLRNQIVHAGNHVRCSYNKLEGNYVSCAYQGGEVYIALEKPVFDYLQKQNILEIGGPPYVEIMPSHAYCQYLVKFGKDFFYKLNKDLKPGTRILRTGHA